MRAQTAGGRVQWGGWCLVAAAVLAGCKPGRSSLAEQDQEQDTEEPTPDPLPGLGAADASPEQLRTACQNLGLEPSSLETTWSNGSVVAIRAAKGNHKITAADLADGRMVSRIEVKSGAGIPEYGIGPNYDSLETVFVSVAKGPVDTFLTSVIHKAKPHPHADADWVSVSGPPLPGGRMDSGARGMIPWLLPQSGRVTIAQSGCGKYQCCLQSEPK